MKIEIDGEREYVIVNGIRISFGLLEALTNPDPNKLYRMVRSGETVTVTSFPTLHNICPTGLVN